jgi:hypothetical protein
MSNARQQLVIFERVVDSATNALTPEVAQYLIALKFRQADLERMHALTLKRGAGYLTADEADEMEDYDRVGELLAILKSKARAALKKSTPPIGRSKI